MSSGAEATIDRPQLVEAFTSEDPRLTPAEKETLLRFSKDRNRFVFDTTEAGLGRRLLAHPEVEIDRVTILREDGLRDAVDPRDVTEQDDIVGVRGTLPLGVLKIASTARKATGHAHVVTHRVLEEVSNGDE